MAIDKYKLLTMPSRIDLLSEKIGGHSIYMFRDNHDDFAFGGNKVRFYECLIPDILKEKPDVLVTSGSMYSNHIRVSALVAKQLGIECNILLSEDESAFEETENIRLAREYGAKIFPVGHFAALLKINEFVEELQNSGKKVYLVPNGGHTPVATQAYKQVALWALNELDRQGVQISTIFLPCASGTTHAGVLCASAERKLPPVISFAVANRPKRAQKAILELIKEAAEYNPGLDADSLQITVLDPGKNEYGKPDEDLLALQGKVFEQNGIMLDPTYNINAFWGMNQYLTSDPSTDNVLYINTGGFY